MQIPNLFLLYICVLFVDNIDFTTRRVVLRTQYILTLTAICGGILMVKDYAKLLKYTKQSELIKFAITLLIVSAVLAVVSIFLPDELNISFATYSIRLCLWRAVASYIVLPLCIIAAIIIFIK